jgi:hypothetical protein
MRRKSEAACRKACGRKASKIRPATTSVKRQRSFMQDKSTFDQGLHADFWFAFN